MTTAIGVVITENIVAGRLEDLRPSGKLLRYPNDPEAVDALAAIPDSELVEIIAGQVEALSGGENEPPKTPPKTQIDAIGIAVPGLVRSGVVEESPNLKQLKGMHLADSLARALEQRGIKAPVHVANDANAVAAGVAATHGRLDKLTRVWMIGNGIGYGRWPYVEGLWEGGHITVTLDPKERYCGCGASVIWRASWAIAPCACASSTWSRKKSSPTPKMATCVAARLLTCGIARWPLPRLRSFTLPAQAVFTSRGTTWAFWSCHCCAATWKLWCG